jgi:hypothetical protein
MHNRCDGSAWCTTGGAQKIYQPLQGDRFAEVAEIGICRFHRQATRWSEGLRVGIRPDTYNC